MKIEENKNEICLDFKYHNKTINAVLHSSFDMSNQYVTIIVPGVFGDRGDSRAMFTRIAKSLYAENFSVLRFDFFGGGSNLGDYSENTFENMVEQLKEVTDQLLSSFTFIKKVIYVGFSEGLKIAYFATKKRGDVVAIISCNGLCVEECCKDKIKRPKIKNGKMVYDSYLGLWINWDLVERYKDFYINDNSLLQNINFFGIYSTDDVFSTNSRMYWEKQGWSISLISQADHLFTKEIWIQKLIKYLLKWHIENIKLKKKTEREFFLNAGVNKICIKLIEKKESSIYLIFVHGLFQNKSGPGFLFTQMANVLCSKFNVCMFDFPGSGDSDGKTENLSIELMDEALQSVLKYLNIKNKNKNIKFIGIASGSGNYVLYNNKIKFYKMIFLFPHQSNIWKYISNDFDLKGKIDTSIFFEKYCWAYTECCILGNVYNRSKGMLLATRLLKELSEFDVVTILEQSNAYTLVNQSVYCNHKNSIYLEDKEGLAMSASVREKVIQIVGQILKGIMEAEEND